MLYIDYRDSVVLPEHSGVLDTVKDVAISETINGDRTLIFTIPYNTYIPTGSYVVCEGQRYRVVNTGGNTDDAIRTVTCQHSFNFDAKKAFIPNIGHTSKVDLIGVQPIVVLEYALGIIREGIAYEAGNPFELFNDDELAVLGMQWINLEIDFESTDKTTLWDVVTQIIAIAGRGEIYADNHKFAIVDRIGLDTNSTIYTSSNMKGVSVEYDISEMVTVLYPYGRDGLEIKNKKIDGAKYGKDYIKADGISEYLPLAGYRDYDIADVDGLFNRALWEFDEANPNRICVPSVNVSGTAENLHLSDETGLGDTIGIMINNADGTGRVSAVNERVISIKRYPYSGKSPELSIGKVKKDMHFYLNQLGVLSRRYKNISAVDGRIFGTNIKGKLSVNGHTITTKNGDLYYDDIKLN